MNRNPFHVFDRRALAAVLALALGCVVGTLAAQQALTPAFTYQGELRLSSGPATGNYDMRFRLYSALEGGAQIGSPVEVPNVPVTGGLFSVPLDFGPAQFAGERQWLEIQIRPAGSGSYETLSPRTEVTAAPYAWYAWGAQVALPDSVTSASIVDGSIGSADIDPEQIQRRVTGTCPSGQYLQAVSTDGTVSCGTDAGGTVTSIATGTGLTGGPITGSGTISVAPGGIGTTQINSAQVQRRVTGTCPSGQYLQAVNADGTVSCGAAPSGWSLSGNAGTDPATHFLGTTDAVPLVLRAGNGPALRLGPLSAQGQIESLNVIAGHPANLVGEGVAMATISGGGRVFGGSSTQPNRVLGDGGTIGGGVANVAGAPPQGSTTFEFATVSGGFFNQATGFYSTVGGGADNLAITEFTTVAGGANNQVGGIAGTIGGGIGNRVAQNEGTVAGGGGNEALGFATTVSGGSTNFAFGDAATVSGGQGSSADGFASMVGGGNFNFAGGDFSTIAGGFRNLTYPGGQGAAIAGGSNNTALGSWSSVTGGQSNTAVGESSAVGGGTANCAGGLLSWAGGFRAKVRPPEDIPDLPGGCDGIKGVDALGHAGTFIWADSQNADFVSSGQNQFLVRAAGGFGINSNNPTDALHVVSEADANALRVVVGNTTRLRVYGTGGVGIGSNMNNNPPQAGNLAVSGSIAVGQTDPVGNRLRVNGTLRVDTLGSAGTTSLCRNGSNQIASCSSSARYKQDIADLDLGLTTALRLHAVGYRWKDSGTADIGFIAEEVAKIDERLVTRNDKGEIEGVKYERLTAVLANAVQELAARDSLATETLARLAAENAELRVRLERLEALLADRVTGGH